MCVSCLVRTKQLIKKSQRFQLTADRALGGFVYGCKLQKGWREAS
jgi:hypothetical protein